MERQSGWQLPDPIRELEAKARMSEDACILTPDQRAIVEGQVAETCQHRGWTLHAVNCRSNHMHALLSAPGIKSGKVLSDLKAWCTRRLKEQSNSDRTHWWAERGSARWILTEESLHTVYLYVTEAQDRKHLEQ